MELKDILRHLHKYEYLQDGKLVVFSPSFKKKGKIQRKKRMFRWNDQVDQPLFALAWFISIYFEEVELSSRIGAAKIAFSPYFAAIHENLDILRNMASVADMGKVEDNLRKLGQATRLLEGQFEKGLEKSKVMAKVVAAIGKTQGNLGPDQAVSRLEEALYDCLRTLSNLTQENAVWHVRYLTQHFGIMNRSGRQGDIFSLRRQLGKRRKSGKREERILALVRRAEHMMEGLWGEDQKLQK